MKQLTHEVIIDHSLVNQEFINDGGAARLNGPLGKRPRFSPRNSLDSP